MALVDMQFRRGPYNEFDKDKMLPGEPAAVLRDDPSVPSGKAFYVSFGAGDVRRLVSIEDLEIMLEQGYFTGEQGPQGVGIENLEINNKSHLIITLTNGSTVDAGYIDDALKAIDDAKAAEKNASTSATSAEKWAKYSESYAHGGTGTRSGEDNDNAEVYAKRAEDAASKVGSLQTQIDDLSSKVGTATRLSGARINSATSRTMTIQSLRDYLTEKETECGVGILTFTINLPNSWITNWNNDNTTASLGDGTAWQFILINSPGATGYSVWIVSVYTQNEFYIFVKGGGIWQKVRKIGIVDYLPQASTTLPSAPGTASYGSSTAYARADHVHPLQTTINGLSFAKVSSLPSNPDPSTFYVIPE